MLDEVNKATPPTFLKKVSYVVKDLKGEGIGSWFKAVVTSLNDRDLVVEKEEKEDGTILHRVKRKVLCAVEGAFERIGYIALHICSLSHVGAKLTPFIEGATGFIDATRIFGFVDWILKGCKTEGKLEFTQQIAFGFVGILSTAYTLHEFKIIDLSFIASGMGTLASYGGFGFVGAIGLVPVIQGLVAIGVVCAIVMTAYKIKELWTSEEWTKENNQAWQEKASADLFMCYVGIVGHVAEVAFRALSIATGTAPVVLPILGLISNGIGYFKIVKTTRDENTLTESVELDLKNDKIKVPEKDKVELEEKILVKEDKKPSEPTLWNTMKSIVDGTAQIFVSTKGMDKLSKFGDKVIGALAPLAKGPIGMIKCFRECVGGISVAESLSSNPIEKGKITKTTANLFLFAGNLFDTAAFVTKANIANLGRYAGSLGKFKIFGVVKKVTFSSLKASCMAVFMALDLYLSFGKIRESYKALNEKKIGTDEYDKERNELLIKLFLSAGKIGAIMVSGAFIFVGGFSVGAVFTVYEGVVFGADLVNWIRKNVVNKPDDLVFEPKPKGENIIIIENDKDDKVESHKFEVKNLEPKKFVPKNVVKKVEPKKIEKVEFKKEEIIISEDDNSEEQKYFFY